MASVVVIARAVIGIADNNERERALYIGSPAAVALMYYSSAIEFRRLLPSLYGALDGAEVPPNVKGLVESVSFGSGAGGGVFGTWKSLGGRGSGTEGV